MAQRVLVVCDLDPKHEEAETVNFGFQGSFYELDLCEADTAKLSKALDPFVKVSRGVLPREAIRRATNGNGSGTEYGSYDPGAVRAWCAKNNVPVNDKGRVPEEIVARWRAATQG